MCRRYAGSRAVGVRALAAAALVLAAVALPSAARAASIAVNVVDDGTVLGGIAFAAGDLVAWDPVTDSAALLLAATAFNKPTTLDAYHAQSDGTIVFSTKQGKRTIGGVQVDSGDVVQYDPITDTAQIILSASVFDKKADVDAVHVLDDGRIAFSVTQDNRSIGGTSFNDGDIVVYDPDTGTASILFSESSFGSQAVDIDGVYLAADGSIYLSTAEDGVSLGGITFNGNDIVRFDPLTNTASIFSDGSLLPPGVDLGGVDVPEPPALVLLAGGLLGLVVFPRVSRRRGRVSRRPDPASER